MSFPIYKSRNKKKILRPIILENDQRKRSDINILLNRVKLNQKKETRKKLFSIIISLLGLILFATLFLK